MLVSLTVGYAERPLDSRLSGSEMTDWSTSTGNMSLEVEAFLGEVSSGTT
jgi:hypothetical protein